MTFEACLQEKSQHVNNFEEEEKKCLATNDAEKYNGIMRENAELLSNIASESRKFTING